MESLPFVTHAYASEISMFIIQRKLVDERTDIFKLVNVLLHTFIWECLCSIIQYYSGRFTEFMIFII